MHEKKRSFDGLSLPNQNTILIKIILYYFTRYRKVQWNSVNKKLNGLEQPKNEKSSTPPERIKKLGHKNVKVIL